jgi:cytidylate kinase
MQIICISRYSYGYGKELAEKLAEKLGYKCIGRDELTDQATAIGIPVGKLEMTIMKHGAISEELAVEIDRYKAFITAALCEQAMKVGSKGGIVYHGRTGHLVLPGLSHVMRIRAITDMEDRIEMVIQRLHLTREKAKTYNEQVDEDIRRWVRFLYNVNWEDPSLYDITINSAHLNTDNAASALVHMAQLPEFQVTPALQQTISDLLLASRCRLAIGTDERTREVKATAVCEKGHVSVTYLPQHSKQAQFIPSILEKIDGIQSLTCTIATTNILYIQEKFNPEAPSFNHLVEIAEKWNAAVELIRLTDQKATEEGLSVDETVTPSTVNRMENHGGILDDTPSAKALEVDGSGMPETINKLIQVGRAGAAHTVYGGAQALEGRLSRTVKYSLIVVGDVFLSKGDAVRKRMKRDLISFLIDHLHVPVIGNEDLKEQYLFGPKQWLQTAGYAMLSILIYLGVFNYQKPILDFLSIPGTQHRVMASAAVAVIVPIAAFIIGGFAHNILKMIKLE